MMEGWLLKQVMKLEFEGKQATICAVPVEKLGIIMLVLHLVETMGIKVLIEVFNKVFCNNSLFRLELS